MDEKLTTGQTLIGHGPEFFLEKQKHPLKEFFSQPLPGFLFLMNIF